MKKDIHPTYYNDCKVTCACGNTFVTGSTKKEINVDICAACHPFFTGEQKFVDTEGRVDKFLRKRKEAEATATKIKIKKEAKKRRQEAEKSQERPKSLKELLEVEKEHTQDHKKEIKPLSPPKFQTESKSVKTDLPQTKTNKKSDKQ